MMNKILRIVFGAVLLFVAVLIIAKGDILTQQNRGNIYGIIGGAGLLILIGLLVLFYPLLLSHWVAFCRIFRKVGLIIVGLFLIALFLMISSYLTKEIYPGVSTDMFFLLSKEVLTIIGIFLALAMITWRGLWIIDDSLPLGKKFNWLKHK